MKRILILCVAAALGLLLGNLHAQPIDREMFAKVTGMNSKRNCPMWVDHVTVEKLTYSSGVLHFHITAEEDVLMGLSPAELKEFCADRLRYRLEHTYFNYLYSHLGDINGGVAYDVSIKGTDSAFTIRYSPQEMRQIWADRSKPAYKDGERWNARLDMQMDVYASNRQSADNPIFPGQTIVRDSIFIDHETLVFHFRSINDTVFNDRKGRQDEILEQLRNDFVREADLLEEVVEAEYAIRFEYANASRTDSFSIGFTVEELERLLDIADNLVPANDSQMDAYMKEALQEMAENMDSFDSTGKLKLVSADYMDGMLLFVISVSENTMNFNMTPNEQEIIKKAFISVLKTIIDESFETPEIWDNTIVTKEMFLDRLKGVRVLYMEENTHRTNDIDITKEEIVNGKPMVTDMDSLTREKVMEQMLPEIYANDVEKYSRENLPAKTGPVTMERIRYDGESLHLYCSIDSTSMNRLDTSILRTLLRNQIASAQGSSNFYDPLITLNGGVMFHYRIQETDSTIAFYYFSPERVREIMSAEDYSEEAQAQNELNLLIISTNLQCPVDLDGSIRLDSTGIDNGRFVYYYTVSESSSSLSLHIARDWMRAQIEESEDESLMYLLELCIKTGNALSYRYFKEKQEQPSRKKKAAKPQEPVMEIVFTVDELRDMLH